MKSYALFLLVLLIAACSPAPVAEVPTLLVVPTVILTPTSTRPPTETPTPTEVLPPTETPIPSETPTASPTFIATPDRRVCDATEWWAEVEPILTKYLNSAEAAMQHVDMNSLALLEMERYRDEFEAIEDYPLCIVELQFALSVTLQFTIEDYEFVATGATPVPQNPRFTAIVTVFQHIYNVLPQYGLPINEQRLDNVENIFGVEPADPEMVTLVEQALINSMPDLIERAREER